MTKAQEHKYLLWGGIAVGAGLLWWWYSNQQQNASAPVTVTTGSSTASSAAPTTASLPQVVPAQTNTDPTQAGAMDFEILWVAADNQQGAYNVIFNLAITNNTSIPQTLQGIQGTATFVPQASVYMNDKLPNPYTGILGTVNDNTTVTIGAGQTATKIYVVNVPVNSATNLYVANLAYIMADPATRNLPFNFTGTANVSNDTLNLNINYNV